MLIEVGRHPKRLTALPQSQQPCCFCGASKNLTDTKMLSVGSGCELVPFEMVS